MEYAEIMRFTDREMICFNSILGGGSIVGINIEIPGFVDKGKYILETINRLKQKELVDTDGNLNKYGMIPIRLLEAYKNAQSYIFINEMRIGIIDEDNVVILEKSIGGTSIRIVNKIVLLAGIISDHQVLQNKQDKMTIKERNLMLINYEGWVDTMEDMDAPSLEILFVVKYDNGNLVCNKVYYWDKNNTYLYDVKKQRRKIVGSVDIRTDIMKLLEMRKD